jgi:hypothetical protein
MGIYYKPEFEEQSTGSTLQWFNCAAASGAMLTDRATLGIKDPTPDKFRRKTGDTKGGLYMGSVGNALEAFGVDAMVWDADDHLRFKRVEAMAKRGQSIVIAGDYEVLPRKLRGDKDYQGDHSVFLYRMFKSVSIIGDPLNDGRRSNIPKGWIQWPNATVYEYVKRFDQHTMGGIHAATARLQWVKARSQVAAAEIREAPEKSAKLVGVLLNGKRLNTGGTVVGEEIRGQVRWFKVWNKNQIGYIHASVAYRA